MSKTCSCGARFDLHVELAVHCQKTGHSVQPARDRVQLTVQHGRRRPAPGFSRSVVAGITLLSLLGLTAGFKSAVSTYTAWQCTAQVLHLP